MAKTAFPIAPPVEPMLAKLATELPAGDFLLRAEMGRISRHRLPRRRGRVHSKPRPAAARPLLSRAARGLPRRLAGWLRGRRRDRDRHASRARFRHPANAASSRRVARRQAREGNAGRVRRVRCAGCGREGSARAAAERASRAPRAAARRRQAADPPDADDARRGTGVGMAGAVRGRGPRRRDRETGRRHVQARQARDDQGEARPHRRLCRRRISLAQEGEGRARRLAAARAL